VAIDQDGVLLEVGGAEMDDGLEELIEVDGLDFKGRATNANNGMETWFLLVYLGHKISLGYANCLFQSTI
jgi:hypothetical protein